MTNIRSEASADNIGGVVDYLHAVAGGGRIAVSSIVPDGAINAVIFRTTDQRADLTAWLQARNGNANLYYSLNEPHPDAIGRLREDDVITIRGVAVDLDPQPAEEAQPGGYERERARLFARIEELKSSGLAPPPTAIIDSGGGVQAVWRLSEPLPNTRENRAAVKAHARGLGVELGSDAVQSIDHLFRIPFTENLPNAKKVAKGRAQRTACLLHYDPTATASLTTLAMIAAPIYDAPASKAADLDDFDYREVIAAAEDPSTLPAALTAAAVALRDSRRGAAALANPDRSDRDFALACLCIEAGIVDPTAIGQIVFSLAPEKLLEKDGTGYGETYAAGTVRRALEKATPTPKADDWFEGDTMPAGTPPPVNLPAPLPVFDVIRGPIDPKTVPTREYVISPRLPVGDVSQLIGAPGTGKSTFMLRDALAVATGNESILRGVDRHGNPITAERIHRPGAVLIVNGEDSRGDMRRRLIANYAHHRVTEDHHPVILWSGVDGPGLRIMERKGDRAPLLPADGLKLLEDTIGKYKIVLVAIDPQISIARGALENSNEDADLIMSELARLATRMDVSIALAHHTGKATRGAAGDLNAGRGASAFGGKARFVSTLVKVSEEDAKTWGLPYTNDLIRLDNAKASHDRQPDGPTFFRRVSVPVGNGTGAAAGEMFAGNAREQLRAKGEEAPVLQIVDHRGLTEAAKGKAITKAAADREEIARIAGAVLASIDDAPLSDVWPAIGERMREARLCKAKGRTTVQPYIVSALTEGVRVELGGQIVLISAVRVGSGWHIRRSVEPAAADRP